MSDGARLAILGAGPAGCTLASLLALRGVPSVVFDDDKRPDLLVGESLLPTVVLALRRLGIEERVAAISVRKPGVSFLHRRGTRVDFAFPGNRFAGLPEYAYNVPRPQFDQLLRQRAEELGVRFINRRAEVVKAEGDARRELELSKESLRILGGGQPDLLADCTGRARVSARALGLPARRGERNDVALFAHFENFECPVGIPGQVVITALDCGWSWQIPLRNGTSVGVVIDRAVAGCRGRTPEERLENSIRSEPMLAAQGDKARRITPVMSYTNYQLISERGYGPGWVAIGDAFGFVDPMFSPGLFMAMEAASLVERHVFSEGAAVLDDPARMRRGFERYLTEMRDWHRCWRELIEHVYSGRFFALCESGQRLAETHGRLALPRLIERYLSRQIAGMVSGLRTRSGYSRRLVRFATNRLAWGVGAPEDFAIRGS